MMISAPCLPAWGQDCLHRKSSFRCQGTGRTKQCIPEQKSIIFFRLRTDTALEELKPKHTTLNHIKYNFDVLERDYLPEEKDPRREESPER